MTIRALLPRGTQFPCGSDLQPARQEKSSGTQRLFRRRRGVVIADSEQLDYWRRDNGKVALAESCSVADGGQCGSRPRVRSRDSVVVAGKVHAG